jgi:cell division protein FtsN
VSARSARERRAASGGLGWFTTLGGASLLLAFGFGIGLVAGSALEEPDLVASHLAGEATEVPLPAQAPPAAKPAPEPAAPAPAPEAKTPDAADEAPAGLAERGDEGAPTAAPPPAVKPSPPDQPAPSTRPQPRAPALAARPTGFAVQVGAFADRRAADELVASLQRERFRAYVVEGTGGESAPYRVRVGPYPTREKAGDEAARLHARRRLPTWVIAEGGT